MEINYLIDTNVVIAFLKNEPSIAARLQSVDEMVISIITVGEMLYGAETSLQKEKITNLYNAFFETCSILSIDTPVAREYAHIRSTLKSMGKPIPENDVWIAATTKAYNRTLVTRDRHLLELKTIIDVQEW